LSTINVVKNLNRLEEKRQLFEVFNARASAD